jgi:hypothetical protein
MDYLFEAYRARKDFAERLRTHLRDHGFKRLFWAGDGGAFTLVLGGVDTADQACSAADEVFQVFQEWRQKNWDVGIRVSATLIKDVVVDSDPAYWYSPDLNTFLKYEREISVPDGFVITDELRRELAELAQQKRFEHRVHKRLPNGQSLTIYVDKYHPGQSGASGQSFYYWLQTMVKENKMPQSKIVERSLVRVGQCTVLQGAVQPWGYSRIESELVERADLELGIDTQDLRAWQDNKAELGRKSVSGTVTAVRRFTQELTEDYARLECQEVRYLEARAFLALLEDERFSHEAPSRYRDRALDVLAEAGTKVPNILSTGVVVIIGKENQPLLAIAHRKGRTGGFHGSRWAVTSGEQFKPVKEHRDGRIIGPDHSILESAERGLREELLGLEYTRTISMSVHALVMEDYINNYFFVAIADLRPLEFDELCTYWGSQTTVDRWEHDAIGALPLTRTALIDCLKGDRLPAETWEQIRNQALVAFQPGLSELVEESHLWQQNSHVRLAACLWYLADELK